MTLYPVPNQILLFAQLPATVHSHSCGYLLLHGHIFLNPGLLILKKATLWLGKLVFFCSDSVRGWYLHARSGTWPRQDVPLKLLVDRLSSRWDILRVEVILRLHRITIQLGQTTQLFGWLISLVNGYYEAIIVDNRALPFQKCFTLLAVRYRLRFGVIHSILSIYVSGDFVLQKFRVLLSYEFNFKFVKVSTILFLERWFSLGGIIPTADDASLRRHSILCRPCLLHLHRVPHSPVFIDYRVRWLVRHGRCFCRFQVR